MYQRDLEIIEKLRANARGEYPRLAPGDVEYIVHALTVLGELEDYAAKFMAGKGAR